MTRREFFKTVGKVAVGAVFPPVQASTQPEQLLAAPSPTVFDSTGYSITQAYNVECITFGSTEWGRVTFFAVEDKEGWIS